MKHELDHAKGWLMKGDSDLANAKRTDEVGDTDEPHLESFDDPLVVEA